MLISSNMVPQSRIHNLFINFIPFLQQMSSFFGYFPQLFQVSIISTIDLYF